MVQFIYNSIDLKLSVCALLKMVCSMITSAIQFISSAQFKSNTCRRTVALCFSFLFFMRPRLFNENYLISTYQTRTFMKMSSWMADKLFVLYFIFVAYTTRNDTEFINEVRLKPFLFLIVVKYFRRILLAN